MTYACVIDVCAAGWVDGLGWSDGEMSKKAGFANMFFIAFNNLFDK